MNRLICVMLLLAGSMAGQVDVVGQPHIPQLGKVYDYEPLTVGVGDCLKVIDDNGTLVNIACPAPNLEGDGIVGDPDYHYSDGMQRFAPNLEDSKILGLEGKPTFDVRIEPKLEDSKAPTDPMFMVNHDSYGDCLPPDNRFGGAKRLCGVEPMDVPAITIYPTLLPVFDNPPQHCNTGQFIEGYSREFGCTSTNKWRRLPTASYTPKDEDGEWCDYNENESHGGWAFKDDNGGCREPIKEHSVLGCDGFFDSGKKYEESFRQWLADCRLPGRNYAANGEHHAKSVTLCADRSRFLLTSQDGKHHCLKF